MQHMCNAFIYLCVCVAKRAEKIGFISDPYSMLHSYKDVCLEETDPAKHVQTVNYEPFRFACDRRSIL